MIYTKKKPINYFILSIILCFWVISDSYAVQYEVYIGAGKKSPYLVRMKKYYNQSKYYIGIEHLYVHYKKTESKKTESTFHTEKSSEEKEFTVLPNYKKVIGDLYKTPEERKKQNEILNQ